MKAKLTQQAADNLVWGETDFYYWEDNDKVMEVFYRECVEA